MYCGHYVLNEELMAVCEALAARETQHICNFNQASSLLENSPTAATSYKGTKEKN